MTRCDVASGKMRQAAYMGSCFVATETDSLINKCTECTCMCIASIIRTDGVNTQEIDCNELSLEPSPFPRKILVHTACSRMCWIFTLFREKSMICQWVDMHFYDKLVHAKNSVYQALILDKACYI